MFKEDWSQILAIFIATLVTLTSGLHFTWPTPSIPILISTEHPVDISIEQASYLTVLGPLTIIIASPIFAQLVDTIGRKNTLLLTTLPQLLAWILIAYGGEIYIYYIARICVGISDAACYTVVAVYIAEVVTPRIRGTWGNAITFMVYLGNFLSNLVGVMLSIRDTALIFSIIPMVCFVLTCFMPETPYYLLSKNRHAEAKQNLKWLRRKDNVDEELKQLTYDVNRQLSESGKIKDLFVIATNRKAVIIGAFLRFAQQFSGISGFASYTHFLFASVGDLSPSTSTLIFSGLLLVTNFLGAFVLEKLGRRKSMIISCFGCAIVLACMTVYFCIDESTITVLKVFPLIGMSLYVLFYSFGIGILPSLMLGELFSSSIKGKGLCVMNISFGLQMAVCTKMFQFLMTNYGLYVPFAFFAICTICSTIASFFIVPETKGKTLEEIQQSLK